jgi:1-acyl-sn-glycerol-3-phosphate acyltransferase
MVDQGYSRPPCHDLKAMIGYTEDVILIAVLDRLFAPFSFNHRKQQMLRVLSRFLLRMLGWTLDENLPPENKYVLVGAPHTSNWDLPLGLLFMSAVGMRFNWVVKHTVFRGPVGAILRSIGGIPINRRIRSGFIEQMGERFASHESMILVIAPEGTRSKTLYWKTGFYYIALHARVPITLGYLDYRKKKLGIGYSFLPSGDIEKDMEIIRVFYRGKRGKHPEKQGEIKVRSKE